MNPYEELNVAKEASGDTIRNIFRCEARKHHPDNGGEPVKFAKVKAAYDILIDPRRRAKYDETGQVDDGADNRMARAASCLINAFNATVGQVPTSKLYKVDLVAVVKRAIADKVAEHRNNRAKQVKELRTTIALKKRLAKKGDKFQPFIEVELEKHRRKCIGALVEIDKVVADLHLALDMLGEYEYRYDYEPMTTETGNFRTIVYRMVDA